MAHAHRRVFLRYCGRAPHWAQKAAPFPHEEGPSPCGNRIRFLCALVARAGELQNPQRFLPAMSPSDSWSVTRAHTMRQPLDRVRAVSQVMRQGRTSRGSTSPSTCFEGHCRRQPDHEVAQQPVLRGPTSSSRRSAAYDSWETTRGLRSPRLHARLGRTRERFAMRWHHRGQHTVHVLSGGCSASRGCVGRLGPACARRLRILLTQHWSWMHDSGQ